MHWTAASMLRHWGSSWIMNKDKFSLVGEVGRGSKVAVSIKKDTLDQNNCNNGYKPLEENAMFQNPMVGKGL